MKDISDSLSRFGENLGPIWCDPVHNISSRFCIFEILCLYIWCILTSGNVYVITELAFDIQLLINICVFVNQVNELLVNVNYISKLKVNEYLISK